MAQTVLSTPIGPVTLYEEEGTLVRLRFGDHGGKDATPLLAEAERQLTEYFAGKRREFHLPLNPQGTAFQRRVWTELTKIPYGTAISYRDLALHADCPKGFQAVGQANGKNPLAIFIPCHRVIAADGTLGGYAGGLEAKKTLLNLENIPFRV